MIGRRAGTPWARALGLVAPIGIVVSALISGAEAQSAWSEVARMPTARYGLAGGVVGGKLYAVGGDDLVTPVTQTTEMYDPSTSAWKTKESMPTARRHLAAGVLGGKLYALGGENDRGRGRLDTVEVYDPAKDMPPPPSSPSGPAPSSPKTAVVIGAAAGGVALLASVAAAIVIKRRRALYRQQAARLTMARASASPSLASV